MMPQNVLSDRPISAPFLAPRNTTRFSTIAGQSDVHNGGVAVGDPSQGISFQTWTAFISGGDIWLGAPNTPAAPFLTGLHAAWVGVAFDQNARIFLTWADLFGNASYYWFDSTISNYRISTLSGLIFRPFACLDDSRPIQVDQADVLLAYVRAGVLYFRQQRDRYGIEYTLGTAPATLVQIGMNQVNRFQFAFQNVQGNSVLPPAEWNLGLGINEPS